MLIIVSSPRGEQALRVSLRQTRQGRLGRGWVRPGHYCALRTDILRVLLTKYGKIAKKWHNNEQNFMEHFLR